MTWYVQLSTLRFTAKKILDYVSNVAGPALLKGLNELQAEFPEFIRNVRGKGLMCVYDICSPELRDKFLQGMPCKQDADPRMRCQHSTLPSGITFRSQTSKGYRNIPQGREGCFQKVIIQTFSGAFL